MLTPTARSGHLRSCCGLLDGLDGTMPYFRRRGGSPMSPLSGPTRSAGDSSGTRHRYLVRVCGRSGRGRGHRQPAQRLSQRTSPFDAHAVCSAAAGGQLFPGGKATEYRTRLAIAVILNRRRSWEPTGHTLPSAASSRDGVVKPPEPYESSPSLRSRRCGRHRARAAKYMSRKTLASSSIKSTNAFITSPMLTIPTSRPDSTKGR